MHYKNGREAKPGDHVITKDYAGNIIGGVVFSLAPQATATCNANVAYIRPGGTETLTCQTVGEMYHVEDAFVCIDMCAKTPPPPPSTS